MLPAPLDKASRLPWEESTSVQPAPDEFPGISIVVPIFNAGPFLERTLRSLLLNDLKNVEIIVMDGGSTDNTGQILEHYKDYFKVCVSEPDRGQSDAINKGFAHATKPILYWLNGDDLILPNSLLAVREVFFESKSVEVVVGDAYLTELDLTPIRHFEFTSKKLGFGYLINYAENHLVQPSVFFTREAWDECGPVSLSLHYAMDADLFLSMSARYRFVHIPVDIAYSVYHEGCKTRDKRAESISELGLVQAKHGGFEEARLTLDLLVDMYNQSSVPTGEREGGAASGQDGCGRCALTIRKLEAVQKEMERNRRMLLTSDLETA